MYGSFANEFVLMFLKSFFLLIIILRFSACNFASYSLYDLRTFLKLVIFDNFFVCYLNFRCISVNYVFRSHVLC